MSWIARLLGFKDVVMPDVEKILKEDKRHTKEVFLDKNNVRGRDISEPVFAMLNAWRQNPKRFKLILDKNISNLWHESIQSYYRNPTSNLKVNDSEGKESFCFGLSLHTESYSDGYTTAYHMVAKFATHRIYPVLGCKVNYYPSWMTQDELDFIIDTVKPYYLKRVNRYRDIVESRIDRTRKASELKSEIAKQKERDRLVEIYK